MVSYVACISNSISAAEAEEVIRLRNYRIYKAALVYSGGCIINLKNKTGEIVTAEEDSLILLTKNSTYDVTILKKNTIKALKLYILVIFFYSFYIK